MSPKFWLKTEGFWYDAKANLCKVKTFTEKYYQEGVLSQTDLEDLSKKLTFSLRLLIRSLKARIGRRGKKRGLVRDGGGL